MLNSSVISSFDVFEIYAATDLKLFKTCTRNFDAHHPYDPYHPYFNLNSYAVDGRDGVIKSL